WATVWPPPATRPARAWPTPTPCAPPAVNRCRRCPAATCANASTTWPSRKHATATASRTCPARAEARARDGARPPHTATTARNRDALRAGRVMACGFPASARLDGTSGPSTRRYHRALLLLNAGYRTDILCSYGHAEGTALILILPLPPHQPTT